MVKILILADDFTGALDTGVQFASKGIKTKVTIERDCEIYFHDDIQALVVDTETRHISPQDAYQVVYHIVEMAIKAGIPYLYKKTDSALRGNIGSELTAFLEASKKELLPFLPAFPEMDRKVKNGVLYIDGLPASKSVFGKDPFEPVKKDKVCDIIAEQSSIQVQSFTMEPFQNNQQRSNLLKENDSDNQKSSKQENQEDTKKILVFDCETKNQMEQILNELKQKTGMFLLAGCAGCAQHLPGLLGMVFEQPARVKLSPNLLVLCGSVNPITCRQLDYGEQCGYKRIFLSPEQKLDTAYWMTGQGLQAIEMFYKACMENRCCMIDTNDEHHDGRTGQYAGEHGISLEEMRKSIPKTMGILLKRLLKQGLNHTYMITGGDTLLGFMNEMNISELQPVRELFPGCVLTELPYGKETYYVITKSGGFGRETLIADIVEALERNTLWDSNSNNNS